MFSLLPLLSLYIHWPFCLAKCPYCDFYSTVKPFKDDINLLSQAYENDLNFQAQQINKRSLKTIFFGGGTPSLMPPQLVENIIKRAYDLWPPEDGCDVEITLEANPTSSHKSLLGDFQKAGINRLSIGIQALNDKDLNFLGRHHTALEGLQTLETAKNIFSRVSFDLIYGRPSQTYKAWEDELLKALTYEPEHLSLYLLTIEEGTHFHTQYTRGDFSLPPDAATADMYELTRRCLESQGLNLYEISNYARAGKECKHNLTYWRYEDYLGIGPGAHGRIRKDGQCYATEYPKNTERWMRYHTEDQTRDAESLLKVTPLLQDTEFEEYLMMSLRLTEGASLSRYASFFDSILSSSSFQDLLQEGYVVIEKDRLTLTNEGRLRHRGIVAHLLKSTFIGE